MASRPSWIELVLTPLTPTAWIFWIPLSRVERATLTIA